MDITLAPVDAADSAAIEQAFAVVTASAEADLPDMPPICRQHFFADFSHPMPGCRYEAVLAYLDGVPAGCLRLTLPTLDNIENVSVELDVHPAHRRRGVGRALHDHLVRRTRELGRKRITTMAVATRAGGDEESPGSAFAAAMGASSVLLDVRRRLDVPTLDQGALDRLLAEAYAHATGYRLVRWSGRAPDEYVEDVAYLEGRLLEDAPIGELQWEPERMDAARLRGVEVAREARGRRGIHCGMRHDESGRLVAWTMLDIDTCSPWHALQQITIVDPQHRGHRLGTIVKIENLRYATAQEPRLRVIDTWNADSNSYMISINEALGFRVVDTFHNWQLSV